MDENDKITKSDIPFFPDAWFIKSFKTRTSENNIIKNVKLWNQVHVLSLIKRHRLQNITMAFIVTKVPVSQECQKAGSTLLEGALVIT